MIRRTERSGEGRWILVSQVEHARLAGALADAWGTFGPSGPREQIVAAIRQHDDGWSAWEVAPKVDAQTGRPLDFTETPLTDSLAIWRDSIDSAAGTGPLAAYMVSGHFCALLERFSHRWKSDATLTSLARGFLDEQQDERQKRLSMWQNVGSGPSGRADGETIRAAADRATAWLQMFDAMSLWFCCAERQEPERFATPEGGEVTMRPASGPYEIEVSPWPFRTATVELEVLGRSIAAQRYANPSDVVTTPAQPVTLRWLLRPPTG